LASGAAFEPGAPAKYFPWRQFQAAGQSRQESPALSQRQCSALASSLHYQLCKFFNLAMKTSVNAILMVSLLTACCVAQTPAFKVLPWNNHPAALSLTFDD